MSAAASPAAHTVWARPETAPNADPTPWPPHAMTPGGPDAARPGGSVPQGPDGSRASDEAAWTRLGTTAEVAGHAPEPGHDDADGYATQVLPPVPSGMPGPGHDAHAPIPGPDGFAGHGSPYGAPAYDDSTTELRAVTLGAAPSAGRNRGGRKGLPLMVAAAVAVVGVAALTAGLFSDDGEADRALPDPKLSAPAVTVAPDGPSGDPEAPSADPSATSDEDEDGAEESTSPTATVEAAPTGDPSDASGDPTPNPTRTKPSTGTTTPAATTAPTLREGDQGPEVVELQQRLKEGQYYWGPANGRYSRKVEEAVARLQRAANVVGDPWGVYGPNSRRALEALTHEP
ncbi:peptidoglycan-binding protein [Streptomyces sp. NPDC086023]|uniref:peptidoglycan-binding protein n=1 Tax=Streptomyces sp. NPDC086023 TaxID=3365746 RepID=UPI0037D0F42C